MNLLLLANSEGPGNPVSFELLPAITAFTVFGVAFAILAVKVWPTIAKALDERNAKIVGEIKAAEDARTAAKAAQTEFEKSLANAREEAANMIKASSPDRAIPMRFIIRSPINGLHGRACGCRRAI